MCLYASTAVMHVQDEVVANTGGLRVEDMKQACKALGLKVSGEPAALWMLL